MRWFVVSSVLVGFLGFLFIRNGNNNVCKTFDDYYTNRDANENCYYNPDFKLEVPEIVKRNGYPIEQYHVTTQDGYILTVFRIPHGKNTTTTEKRKPIFLQHGMTLNSGTYVNIGEKSLAYILADAGFDVWLGNFRGSLYSRNHTTLSFDDETFWDFSFHENGVYDLPAQLNLVHKINNQKIIFLGYSLGSTAAYIYTSLFPKESQEKIEIIVNFAPSIYVEDVGFLFNLIGQFWFLMEKLLQPLTKGKLFVRQPVPFELVRAMCLPFPFQMKICQLMEMSALGFNFPQNDPETLPITILHNTDTASIKSISHFIQMGHAQKFQNFDYGAEKNQLLYGSKYPPIYNLSNILVPSYTFIGKNDLGVSQKSIDRLYQELPKKTTTHGIYYVEDSNFNHLNFITAKDIVPLVYNHLILFLNKFVIS
ncbi:hypothetical protein FQR65_LT10864 [Abscondita terminalis]|nr:hypothetical protein FQR65_LT10864 [Abscondita terminalis]